MSQYFSNHELGCHCGRHDCDAVLIQAPFVAKLDALRAAWGAPLSPTSASRCPYWNAKIGGAPHSQHLLGNAADFIFAKPADARAFAEVAEKVGMVGIGQGRHLVHVDDRAGPPARWTYSGR